jgi:nitroimidazol reductase NimA-like FMN-containing flavoprotein (pyridoxamine 5'-phosphate oxidase superfamily)
MLRTLGQGIDVCVTVTLIDGLVLARSAFNHSMNYRSVVVFGRATPVEGPAAKAEALRALSEHMIPGRWDDVREPTERELQQTTVLLLPLTEASAKVRTGPPLDDEEDYDLPVWAGVIPLSLVADEPVDDPRLSPNSEVPKYAVEYARPVLKH